jgi:ribulose kinase
MLNCFYDPQQPDSPDYNVAGHDMAAAGAAGGHYDINNAASSAATAITSSFKDMKVSKKVRRTVLCRRLFLSDSLLRFLLDQ